MEIKILTILVIALLIGFGLGYGVGFTKGSIKSMEIGLRFAKSFMNIEFNEREIANGIFNYENRINDCFDSKNI